MTDTLVDNDGDGLLDPTNSMPGTEKLTYTATIHNTGTDATHVKFTVPLDSHTTLVGTPNTSPIANADTYAASGNIPISLAVGSVLANDIDPDSGNNALLTVTEVQGSGANVGVATDTDQPGRGGVKGSVKLNADGSFDYEPPPGFVGADTFTYKTSDATTSSIEPTTVTVNISGMVWFINNNAGGSLNRGTFSNPFTTIAFFNTANTSGVALDAKNGDIVALRTGIYTETDGINLRNTQKLIGNAVQFSTVFTAAANSSSAYTTFAGAAASAPTIVTTAGNGVDLADSNTVRGLNVGNTPGFFGFNGAAVGSPVINTVNVTGTGGAISVSTSGAFASNVSFGTLDSSSSPGANINLVGVTGTLGVSSAGAGLSGSTTNGITVNGGSVTLSYPGDVSKGSAGSLLNVANSHSGTLTFTGTLSATLGDGLQFNNADGTYNFTGTTTLNGGDAGIDVSNNSFGTFSFNANTSIANPTNEAINVQSSAANITYSGSFNKTNGGRGVLVQSESGGTILFNGSGVTKTITTSGTANAIDLLSNGSTAINFTNNSLVLSASGSGIGINATGGTLTVQGTGNTITTATGAALNIVNNNIGLSGLTFQSINVNGAANGIVLNNTGTTVGTNGGLSVTGAGTTAGTGGTIQDNDQGGVFTSTINLSLKNMNFTNANKLDGGGVGVCDNTDAVFNTGCKAAINMSSVTGATFDNLQVTNPSGTKGVEVGINGRTVSGLSIINSTVQNYGNEANEGEMRLFNLTGTCAFTNSAFKFGSGRSVEIRNNTIAASTLNLTIDSPNSHATTNSIFSDTQSFPATGGNGLEIKGLASTVTMNVTIHNTKFLRNMTNGLKVVADGVVGGATGSKLTVNVTNCDFDRQGGIGKALDLDADNNGHLKFNVNNNPIMNSGGGAGGIVANFFSDRGALIEGHIRDNPDIQTGGAGNCNAGSNCGGSGIVVQVERWASGIVDIHNNTISNITNDNGIQVFSRARASGDPSGPNPLGGTYGKLDVTIDNNTTTVSATASYDILTRAGGGAPSDANTTCANVHHNTASAGSGFAFWPRTANATSTLILQGFVNDNTTTWNTNSNTPLNSVETFGAPNAIAGTCTFPSNAIVMVNNPFAAPREFLAQSHPAVPNEAVKSASVFSHAFSNVIAGVSAERMIAAVPHSNSSAAHSTVARHIESQRVQKSAVATRAAQVLSHHPVGRSKRTSTAKARTTTSALMLPAVVYVTIDGGAGVSPANSGFTLPAGKTITVTFQVTLKNLPNVDHDPFPLGGPQVSAQGTVQADSIANVMTDDLTPPSPLPNGATDPTVTYVDLFNSQTDVTSSNTSVGQGDPVTFTATVSNDTTGSPAGTPGTPSGKVQFTIDAAPLTCDQGSTSTQMLNGSGVAVCTTSTIAPGGHTINALYQGDGDHDISTGSPVSQTVIACTSNPVVTSTADDGSVGTLREAIASVCNAPNNTITFNLGTGPHTITLAAASGALAIGKSMVISNTSGESITIVGNGASVFDITSAITVSISGLTISGGNASLGGGGINNAGGTLNLTNVIVSGNSTSAGGGGGLRVTSGTLNLTNSTVSGNTTPSSGGGIFSDYSSTVTLTNSTVSGNNAGGGSGGIHIDNSGTLTMTNSTVSDNHDTASSFAGGIGMYGSTATISNSTISGNTTGGVGGGIVNGSTSTLTLTNVTITGNTAATGGGAKNVGTVNVVNTIIAGNTASADADVTGAFTSQGHNLVGQSDGTNGFTGTGDQVGSLATPLNARLGVLADNGGPTFTHALLPDSPALDAGDNCVFDNTCVPANGLSLTTDQRGTGFGRKRDAADSDTIQTVDIGAFESDPSVEDIQDKTTPEDTPISFSFNIGDATTAFNTITASATTNPSLVSTITVTAGADSSKRTLNITPAADANGTATITVTVQKTVGGSMSDTFVLTVTEVNDAPTANSDSPADIAEDSGVLAIPLTTLLSNDTPGPNEGSQTLTVTGVSNPLGGTVQINGANVEFSPTLNFNGPAGFDYTIQDDGTSNGIADPKTATGSVSFNITPVNDPPSFTKGPDQTVTIDPGPQTVPNWATNILAGPPDESTQTLTFNVTGNTNAALFSTLPAISSTGELTYTPATSASGTATITIELQDNGGGSDTSAAQTFQIIVNCGQSDVVTNTNDSGTGSLRDAVTLACSGDTITFDATAFAPSVTPYTINLLSELVVNKNLTITGPANSTVILNGGGATRIFSVNTGNSLSISNLTIKNGQAQNGGGIYSLGDLTINNSTFTNNHAVGGAGEGGAIDSEGGTLTINNSTISGNSAETNGGGLLNCGDSTAVLTNVTITNNFADSDNDGTGDGGGIGQVSSNSLTLNNTIVAGNFNEDGATDTPDDVFVDQSLPSVIDSGSSHNLIGVDTGVTDISNGDANGNQIGTALTPLDARLAVLANNGGPTQTHALLAGSPALDAGDNCVFDNTCVPASGLSLTTDQRGTGFGRKRDAADLDTIQTVDIGAFESDPSVEDIQDKTTPEDTPISFSFNIGDATTAFGTITASATTNPSLVSTITVTAGADSSKRTLNITPAADANGTATITVTVQKTVGGSMSDTFVLTVNAVPDTPSVTNATTNEDTQSTSGLVITPNLADGPEVMNFKITAITGGTLFKNNGLTAIGNGSFITTAEGAAGLKFTPTPNSIVAGSFQVQASTDAVGTILSPSAVTATITVNAVADTPSVTNATTNEDTQTPLGQLVISRSGVDGPEVSHFKITGITNGTLFKNNGSTAITNGTFITFAEGQAGLRFTPAANLYSPTPTFSFQVQGATSAAGAGLSSGFATATITVNAVADTPSVTNAITNEDTQTASGLVITRNAADGAEVTNFKITGITGGTLFQNNGMTSVSNGNFISAAQGAAGLKFTPAANSNTNGSFQVQASISASDAGLGGSLATATITVNAVNDAPTLDAIGNLTINEDDALQTVNLTGISAGGGESQTLVITATSDNTGLIPNPTVNYTSPNATGTLRFTPVANQNGSALITVTVNDGGGTANGGVQTLVRTFTVTVNAVNDAPVNTVPGAQNVNRNSSLTFSTANSNRISIGDIDAGAAAVQVTLTASNGTLTLSSTTGLAFTAGDGMADATMTFTGTIANINTALSGMVFTPTAGYVGAASVQITTNDQGNTGSGGPLSDTDTVSVVVAPVVVQFNSATYTISEGAASTPQGYPSLLVSVTRTGDTTGASTVHYATNDLSGTAECDVAGTGNASQRCDYLMLSGTLRFAAGDTMKTFEIPIVNDGYVEGAEQFTISLDNPTGAVLGPASLTTVTITDSGTPATDSAHNPYLSNDFFVRMHYVDFLEREPDGPGFADWTSVLNGCGSQHGFLGAPANCDRAHISKGFFGAPEFTDRGFLVYRLYEVGLARLPLYAEYNPDAAQLRGVAQMPSPTDLLQLQINLDNYLAELAARPEFATRYASVSGNNTADATALIQMLETTATVTLPASPAVVAGNMPPQYGRADLINRRATNQFSVVQTVKAFVEQKVVYDREYPRGFVTMQYFAYLHRDPDTTGWNDWVNVILNGKPSEGIAPGDYNHLIFGFIYSTEYRKRFGQP
jgi:hypothetical protein